MKEIKISETFANENVMIDNALPFINPTTFFYKMMSSTLVGTFGSYLEVPSNFGAVFGLSRLYDKDKSGNPIVTSNGKFEKNFSNFDYVDKTTGKPTDLQNAKLPSVDFILQKSPMIPMIEKFKSKWTIEAIQDYVKLAQASGDKNDDFQEIIASELSIEMVAQLDYRCFELMRKKATKNKFTIPTTNQTFNHYDIIQEIQKCGLEMSANLFAPVSFSVFCSKAVAAELMSHPNFISHKTSQGQIIESNVYFQGSIQNIDIFADLFDFSEDKNFLLIGLKDVSRVDNASVIFTPRKFSVYSGMDVNETNQNIFLVLQYGLAFNASDVISENNQDDSILLSYLTF